MIGMLQGRVMALQGQRLTLLTPSGVGYELELTAHLAQALEAKIGTEEELILPTYLHTTQEQSALFGFENTSQKSLFQLLIKVSGIGPKLALSILSLDSPQNLVSMIYAEDIQSLKAAKGLGQKGAERLLVEIKDKVQSLALEMPSSQGSARPSSKPMEEVYAALLALGYRPIEARAKIELAASSLSEEKLGQSVPELLRWVLQSA